MDKDVTSTVQDANVNKWYDALTKMRGQYSSDLDIYLNYMLPAFVAHVYPGCLMRNRIEGEKDIPMEITHNFPTRRVTEEEGEAYRESLTEKERRTVRMEKIITPATEEDIGQYTRHGPTRGNVNDGQGQSGSGSSSSSTGGRGGRKRPPEDHAPRPDELDEEDATGEDVVDQEGPTDIDGLMQNANRSLDFQNQGHSAPEKIPRRGDPTGERVDVANSSSSSSGSSSSSRRHYTRTTTTTNDIEADDDAHDPDDPDDPNDPDWSMEAEMSRQENAKAASMRVPFERRSNRDPSIYKATPGTQGLNDQERLKLIKSANYLQQKQDRTEDEQAHLDSLTYQIRQVYPQ
jgi:hypothetical protein